MLLMLCFILETKTGTVIRKFDNGRLAWHAFQKLASQDGHHIRVAVEPRANH